MSYRDRMNALYERKVVKVQADRVIKVALAFQANVKLLTPVDTGRARSNWHFDIGAASVRIVAPGGDTDASLTDYRLDQTIFISNNLPYIRRLDEGSSKQAPAGFVGDAMERAIRTR